MTMFPSQALQAYLGRTCWMTIKLAGTYSSCSRISSPILIRRVPHYAVNPFSEARNKS
jgi:hypothetical protein